MKSKTAVETLRTQLHSSLATFSRYSSSEDITVEYKLEEAEGINITIPAVEENQQDGTVWTKEPAKDIKAYGLLLMVYQTTEQGTKERRLWLRRYPIEGSLNEVKYQAFKELYDVLIGNFLVNATRTDNKTLDELSNKRQ